MGISLRLSGTAAITLCFAAACQTTPRLRGRDVQVLAQNDVKVEQLVDIAVAPVRLTAESENAPASELRAAACRGLVRRLYSPMSLTLVDRAVSGGMGTDPLASSAEFSAALEASYMPGDVQEDAVLEVRVIRWDSRQWDLRRSLDVAIEARMIDPRDPLGPELWAARIEQQFDFTRTIGVATPGSRAVQSACDQIFVELMSKLPARDVDGTRAPAAMGADSATQPGSSSAFQGAETPESAPADLGLVDENWDGADALSDGISGSPDPVSVGDQ